MAGYLSGDVRDRIIDLREERRLTREQLADAVGISAAKQGRIESGKTETIGNDLLEKYMDYFEVSADFLLGRSNYKSRRNYDIEELQLTEKSVQAICDNKINMEVLNRLLENEEFQKLTGRIAMYFASTVSGPLAARNEVIRTIEEMMKQDPGITTDMSTQLTAELKEHNLYRVPEYAYDNQVIFGQFMHILQVIRKDMDKENQLSPLATKDMVKKIKLELTKTKGKNGVRNATVDDVANAVAKAFMGQLGADADETLEADVRALATSVLRRYEAT